MGNDKQHLNWFFWEHFPRIIHQCRVKWWMAKPSLIYLSTSNSVSENHKTSKIWLLENFLYNLLLIFYYTAVAKNAVFWRKIVPKKLTKNRENVYERFHEVFRPRLQFVNIKKITIFQRFFPWILRLYNTVRAFVKRCNENVYLYEIMN